MLYLALYLIISKNELNVPLFQRNRLPQNTWKSIIFSRNNQYRETRDAERAKHRNYEESIS